MSAMEIDQLLRTTEVARRLNVDRSTVTRMVEDGRLDVALRMPGYRGDLLFDPATVVALTEGSENRG